MIDTDLVRRYIAAIDRKRSLESESKSAGEEIERLRSTLLEQYAEAGAQKLTLDGRTVYLHRELWAKTEPEHTTQEVCEGLKKAGLEHMVKEGYSSSTVSAWLRDLDRNGEEIPEPLQGVLTTTERFDLRVRRA